MTIKKDDWVIHKDDPTIIYRVNNPDYRPDLHSGDWRVVTSLPKPKLSRKELVAWLKAQENWYIEETQNGCEVTCDGYFTMSHAKTLSGAIRKLRKAMGVS